MAIALLVGRNEKETKQFHWFIEDLTRQLIKLDSKMDIRIWPDMGDFNDVDFALVWRHPFGILKKFPHLKCIASLGAGVDHPIRLRPLPARQRALRGLPQLFRHDRDRVNGDAPPSGRHPGNSDGHGRDATRRARGTRC